MLNKHKRTLTVISCIIIIVFALCKCIDKSEVVADARGKRYVGSATCVQCHKTIYDSYANTAHSKSSAPASDTVVKGSFEPGRNTYFYRPNLKMVMEDRKNGLFQVAYQNNEEKQANRFDIAIGSGRKAQTYLYWMDTKVYQLPISYFIPEKSWVNSPGYPADKVRFDRNIPVGCFECHSSYIKVTSNEVAGSRYINNFDQNSLLYGIDCERCHGPAAKHVNFHQEHPQEKESKYIASFSALSREQKVDMCSVCHSGIQKTKRSTFRFVPGNTLNNNFFDPSPMANVDDLDVHGNQKQLLMASDCYTKSQDLTCASCHNSHNNEKEDMALFSKRCMNCHNNENHNFCTLPTSAKVNKVNNCIDCHMPAKPSKLIRMLSNGKASASPDLVRTHYITIYPEETKKFLSAVK
jgi:hypothetical protein